MQNIRNQLKYTTLNRIKPENHSRSNSTTHGIKIAQTDEKSTQKQKYFIRDARDDREETRRAAAEMIMTI